MIKIYKRWKYKQWFKKLKPETQDIITQLLSDPDTLIKRGLL